MANKYIDYIEKRAGVMDLGEDLLSKGKGFISGLFDKAKGTASDDLKNSATDQSKKVYQKSRALGRLTRRKVKGVSSHDWKLGGGAAAAGGIGGMALSHHNSNKQDNSI